jgi:hypothetical protein
MSNARIEPAMKYIFSRILKFIPESLCQEFSISTNGTNYEYLKLIDGICKMYGCKIVHKNVITLRQFPICNNFMLTVQAKPNILSQLYLHQFFLLCKWKIQDSRVT